MQRFAAFCPKNLRNATGRRGIAQIFIMSFILFHVTSQTVRVVSRTVKRISRPAKRIPYTRDGSDW